MLLESGWWSQRDCAVRSDKRVSNYHGTSRFQTFISKSINSNIPRHETAVRQWDNIWANVTRVLDLDGFSSVFFSHLNFNSRTRACRTVARVEKQGHLFPTNSHGLQAIHKDNNRGCQDFPLNLLHRRERGNLFPDFTKKNVSTVGQLKTLLHKQCIK